MSRDGIELSKLGIGAQIVAAGRLAQLCNTRLRVPLCRGAIECYVPIARTRGEQKEINSASSLDLLIPPCDVCRFWDPDGGLIENVGAFMFRVRQIDGLD